MPKYVTRQRRVLLAYLQQHTDETLSAQEIAAALSGERVSLSAVYRNIAELEAEGLLRRSPGAGREGYYQYIGADKCRDCLHLSCKRCGRTFHMDPKEAEELSRALEKTEGFAIDRADTVLYGVCEICRDES